MKQAFVGTRFGRLALNVRNKVELLRQTYYYPESVGTLISDQLATFLVTRLCLPKKGFIDVGAHIGSILSEVAYHDPSIKVFAIEPIPEKITNLRREFPAVKFYGCALSDLDGEVVFFLNTKNSGYSSLVKPRNTTNIVEIKVPQRKLDNLISSDEIDVIKIDVEGAELSVLRGGDKLIARNRPVVMFESGPPSDGDNYAKKPMWHWCEERNFDIVLPNRVAHDAPPLNLDGFIEAHFYPRRTTNYFAIPKERRIEIRDRARIILKGFSA